MKTRKHINRNGQVFFAIFTDGLENASTNFTAKDIQKLLVQADENDWQIRFFCRNENNLFYKQHLSIPDRQIMNVSLNEAGLKAMKNKFLYCTRGLTEN
jgi:hypothetical protein